MIIPTSMVWLGSKLVKIYKVLRMEPGTHYSLSLLSKLVKIAEAY